MEKYSYWYISREIIVKKAYIELLVFLKKYKKQFSHYTGNTFLIFTFKEYVKKRMK